MKIPFVVADAVEQAVHVFHGQDGIVGHPASSAPAEVLFAAGPVCGVFKISVFANHAAEPLSHFWARLQHQFEVRYFHISPNAEVDFLAGPHH